MKAETYRHEEEALLRPDVGTQAQFRKKAPRTYRYDSSLSPALDWDAQPARALGEWLLVRIEEASGLDPPHRFPEPRSRNRLNVAVSRAKCAAYVVASPRLLEARSRTIEDIRLVNALCAFVEAADTPR